MRPDDDPYPGRRQADDLTADDLRAQPAWWFPPPDGHLTGPDALTVMPVDTSAAVDGVCEFPAGRWLLHATFTFADGTTADGHVTYVTGERSDVTTQEPAVCTPRGQVPLWHGVLVPDAARVARLLGALGRTRETAFPVRWQTTLRPPHGAIGGAAPGFLVWRDGRVDAV
jgi:hypothetical protein